MKIINQYISVNNESTESNGELYIEGDISDEKWWDEDVTPKEVAKALKDLGKVKSLDIYVNSYGGSCIAGNSMVSIIDDYKRKNECTANVHIRGIAASMGSGIAMVGDYVDMASNALFMVHKPSTFAVGNADDLEKTITVLNKTEDTLVKNYMRKFNGTEEELRNLMADETWFTAEEAKEYGFVDEVTEDIKLVASAKGIEINNKMFNSNIAELINKKYPKQNIDKKEENKLIFDEKLKEYGIDEEKFKTYNTESSKILEIIDLAVENFKEKAEKPFVEKETVCNALNCEDITPEQLIDYAKAGMNPVEPDKEAENKAKKYDKILDEAKAKALENARRAEGDLFNEELEKKSLDAFDYDEVMTKSNAWDEMAKRALNAGKRISDPELNDFDKSKEANKDKDLSKYMIG